MQAPATLNPETDNRSGALVTLAGAGPGDPELITLKLQKRLQEAKVIITDRLVNPAIITAHASQAVRIIQAGKQGYNELSYTQEEVTALIIEEARKGKRVLRLKGGDVAFFSNVLDELEALVNEQIPFEIIPGITAASGASAYAGIPLTARGYAQGVRFIAFNPNQQFDEATFRSLATGTDTIVVYMAVRNLEALTQQLLSYQADPQQKIAVVEQASTPAQKISISTLKEAVNDFSGQSFASPSLIIIGDVLSLYGRFDWFKETGGDPVFNELQS
ncbi:MAG TPA: uroporphyrinogen-III C-methyltransferase [Chitinophagaceae bacterium]|nr:uroporphyrinogen-III C-methyltransferase [Chitinophagaceae bacterium]